MQTLFWGLRRLWDPFQFQPSFAPADSCCTETSCVSPSHPALAQVGKIRSSEGKRVRWAEPRPRHRQHFRVPMFLVALQPRGLRHSRPLPLCLPLAPPDSTCKPSQHPQEQAQQLCKPRLPPSSVPLEQFPGLGPPSCWHCFGHSLHHYSPFTKGIIVSLTSGDVLIHGLG